MSQDRFRGKVTRITKHWGDGGVTAKVVIEDEPKAIGLIGIQVEGNKIEAGETYLFAGERTTHEKFGDQVKFVSYVNTTPAGRDGVLEYLMQVDGIGDKGASLLWGHYGGESVDRIISDPVSVHLETGINTKVLHDARTAFREQQKTADTMIDLMDFFHKSHVRKNIISELIAEHGEKAGRWVRRNPFRLMKYAGIGFLKCDALYIKHGGLAKRIRRHAYAVDWAIRYEQKEGHTWHDIRDVRRSLLENVGVSRFDTAIEFGIRIGLLSKREVAGRECIALREQQMAEQAIAKKIIDLNCQGVPSWSYDISVDDKGHSPSPHQIEQVEVATTAHVGLLTGGPGTGKTFCVARVAKALVEDGRPLAICAPTGKAAKRCTEAMQASGVPVVATTIHRLLRAQVGRGGFRFAYGKDHRLPHRFVIVDEHSMVDNLLMAALLEALPDGCHLLLVGDKNQLSPVGPGFPLRDLDDSPHVATGRLTEIRRNSGLIVEACHEIRRGRNPQIGYSIDEGSGVNLELVHARYNEHQINALGDVLDKIIDAGYDPIDDTVVLTPTNNGSDITRLPLNWTLQGGLNSQGQLHDPDEGGKMKHYFRVGDPFVCGRNYMAPEYNCDSGWWERTKDGVGDSEVYVVNGEPGKVVDVLDNRVFIELESGCVVAAHIRNEGAIDWELGYALTCHKSQGSEWPVVIVILDGSFGGLMVASRQWVYTSISRAKNRCYLIGSNDTLTKMIGRDDMNARRTDLASNVEHCNLMLTLKK